MRLSKLAASLVGAFVGVMLLVGLNPQPALAAQSIDVGHEQNVNVPRATDWSMKVEWFTEYNSVGTSRTEPSRLMLKHNISLGSVWWYAKCLRLTFKTAGGTVVSQLKTNVWAPETDARFSYVYEWDRATTPTIQLSNAPRVVLEAFPDTNCRGGVYASTTYVFK